MICEKPALYRLGKRSSFWAAFTPSGHGLGQTWQIGVAARNRGGAKIIAPLIETTALRPLGTVTIKGEAYPLLISWHKKCRGGGLNFGGTRKTGGDGGLLVWEMRWLPLAISEDGFRIEMRIQATVRGTGHVHLSLPTTLHQPVLWTLQAASGHGHCAQVVRSGYSAHAVSFAAPRGAAGWDDADGFFFDLPRLPLGGGRVIQFGLRFGAAPTEEDGRADLVKFYTAFADTALHPLGSVAPLDPAPAAARLIDPAAHRVKGAERLYFLPPMQGEEETYFAGLPHEPVGAMAALWNHNRIQPEERIPRLVRFGASGVCADFQVMGSAGEAEPNKGAFWDKLVRGEGRDESGGLTHGLRSNARLARSLFQVYAATHDPLCRQSALNICHWLMLKQNDKGFYEGARTLATRGLHGDGKMLAQPCSLDGVEAIRAFTLAYRETTNEVWIKAAWRIANFLMENRLREFDTQSPPTVAAVILSLLTLDREAPNVRLRNTLSEWGAWLRALPLSSALPSLSADSLHAGLYECAEAGFALFELTREIAYLRYAFSALALTPPESRAASWRTVAAHSQALLALAGLLPESRLDFDALSITLDWRVYTPDPAAAGYVRVQPAGGEGWVESLPLVCRANDQLLLLLLAPPSVEAVTLWKNGKRPLVRDLLTGTLDTATSLHFMGKEKWARVGLFTVDP